MPWRRQQASKEIKQIRDLSIVFGPIQKERQQTIKRNECECTEWHVPVTFPELLSQILSKTKRT